MKLRRVLTAGCAATLALVSAISLADTSTAVGSKVKGPVNTDGTKVVVVSAAEFNSIKTVMSGSSPYGGSWLETFGGVVAEPHAIKPCALFGALLQRDRVTVSTASDRNDTEDNTIVGVPIDMGFLREHWAVAHEVISLFGAGRLGWTFGVTIGTLGSLQSKNNDTSTATDYFLGLTYFINPSMTLAAGAVTNGNDGMAKSHLGLSISIDLTAIGKFFGGK
ncbi:MAG: hypothetical protein P4L46_22745 [Fimbriimonas sp.]|nr:hypothetical protein [Fimbriimonas sp.]